MPGILLGMTEAEQHVEEISQSPMYAEKRLGEEAYRCTMETEGGNTFGQGGIVFTGYRGGYMLNPDGGRTEITYDDIASQVIQAGAGDIVPPRPSAVPDVESFWFPPPDSRIVLPVVPVGMNPTGRVEVDTPSGRSEVVYVNDVPAAVGDDNGLRLFKPLPSITNTYEPIDRDTGFHPEHLLCQVNEFIADHQLAAYGLLAFAAALMLRRK